jgi:putative DNA primase/helicase
LAAGDEDWEKDVRKRLNVKIKAIEAAGNATFIHRSLDLATNDPRVMTAVSAWDHHLNLMGVKNGVVDLRTAQLLPMDQDLLITHSAAVTYDPDARDTLFETFISEVCEGDASKMKFLQKAIGLTLTGERKDNFFMVHGASGTGKSTMLDLIFETMGSYSQKLDATAITEKKGKMQSVAEDKYDRGKLVGCRFVFVSEIQEGADLKDDMIKPMTGDGTISGRLPYGANFDIPATMKLWIGTNHQPFVKDDAIWRRVKAIRFRYKPDPMDETVRGRLLVGDGSAMRAFFAWAVRGAVEYYANQDLNFCEDVERETAIYKMNEDLLGQFLQDTYDVGDPGVDVISLSDVHYRYSSWNGETGRKEWSKDVLRRKLVDAGLMKSDDRLNVYGIREHTGAVRETPLGTLRSAPAGGPQGWLASPSTTIE